MRQLNDKLKQICVNKIEQIKANGNGDKVAQ